MAGFRPDGAHVAHERLDDEVIVIDLDTGAYYSFSGTGADAWSLLGGGHDLASAAEHLAHRYGVAAEAVEGPLQTMLDAMLADGLLVAVDATADPVDELLGPRPTTAYEAPVLERFSDMEELLLLDPIHEVDASGWPDAPAEP